MQSENEIEFTVFDMLDDLDGHCEDHKMMIKLSDGSIHQIAGIEFRNACIGGDDILYIKEVDPLWKKYGEEVSALVNHLYKIIDPIFNMLDDIKIDDTSWIGDMLLIIDQRCEEWLDELNIQHEYKQPFEDSTYNSMFEKIEELDKWVRSH